MCINNNREQRNGKIAVWVGTDHEHNYFPHFDTSGLLENKVQASMQRRQIEFSTRDDIRRTYVPSFTPKHRHHPSIPALLNLKTRWHINTVDKEHEMEVEDEDLKKLLELEKELVRKEKQGENAKIDLGQTEMERIISQMRAMNGKSKESSENIRKPSVSGIEIPRYCDYLQGKMYPPEVASLP